jgi:hypothetical protein
VNPPDIDQALEFLAAVFGTTEDGNVWFSSLSPTGDVCSLASRDADDIEGFLVRHNDPDRGSYFCPSALREGAKGRSKDAVQFITGIHADIDFKDHDKPPAEIRRASIRLPYPHQSLSRVAVVCTATGYSARGWTRQKTTWLALNY